MKTALVTGATDGIGRETVRQLLSRGWHVLVHGRTQAKAMCQAKAFRDGRPSVRVAPVWGDLAQMREVVWLAQQVMDRAPALDVLVNNAGTFEKRRRLTGDGFERTLAVNHFAAFLLTHHLLPALYTAPAARIVTVSSMAHHTGHLDLDDLTFAKSYDGHEAYAASKLANILFTRVLAQKLAGGRSSANCLHPGVIDTKLLRTAFGVRGAPLEQGARTPVFLAASSDVAYVSGKYFVDNREATPSREACDDHVAASLWARSEELLKAFL